MKVIKKQKNSKNCILCGLDNPLGIKAFFYEMEDNSLIATFKFKKEHQSYPSRTHGGMISCVLDETIGRAIWITDPKTGGVTTSLTVKYRKPTPYDVDLFCISNIVKNTDKFFKGEGKIVDSLGNIYATAEASYIKLSYETICEGNLSDEMCYMISDSVKEINIDN